MVDFNDNLPPMARCFPLVELLIHQRPRNTISLVSLLQLRIGAFVDKYVNYNPLPIPILSNPCCVTLKIRFMLDVR